MTETYEGLRDSTSGELGAAWKGADREESNLRTLYQQLKEDNRYTLEYKSEQAWSAFESAKGKIVAGRTKAKELASQQARTAERMSLPFPDGEAAVTTDTSKLLASQNEASRLIRRLDRTANRAEGGPFGARPADVLKEEYRKGLEVGGVMGGAACRGVLMAAEELGVDANAIVDEFRKPLHREALERAQHTERLTDLIATRIPEPPFPRPGHAPRRGGSGPTHMFVPRSGGQQVAQEPGHGGSRKGKKSA